MVTELENNNPPEYMSLQHQLLIDLRLAYQRAWAPQHFPVYLAKLGFHDLNEEERQIALDAYNLVREQIIPGSFKFEAIEKIYIVRTTDLIRTARLDRLKTSMGFELSEGEEQFLWRVWCGHKDQITDDLIIQCRQTILDAREKAAQPQKSDTYLSLGIALLATWLYHRTST
jgi:hypothetical protein